MDASIRAYTRLRGIANNAVPCARQSFVNSSRSASALLHQPLNLNY